MDSGLRTAVRVICGPTAAGKSALALALAERFGARIISADSRQIYRGFDIGTAKPTLAELRRVPHEGIDIVEPTERYSAAEWARCAERWIEAAKAAGSTPLVVGGTGFYLRALFDPIFESPPLDPEARARLASMLDRLSVTELRRWCAAIDPERAELGRAQLMRAIETALLTGTRLSELHRRHARAPAYKARYLVIDPGAPLAERIAHRVDAMLAEGWLEEVEALMRRVPSDAPAWKASGYRVMRSVVEGSVTRERAREFVTIETRQYAKRQRTWFRHQLDPALVTRLDPTEPNALELAAEWWHGDMNT